MNHSIICGELVKAQFGGTDDVLVSRGLFASHCTAFVFMCVTRTEAARWTTHKNSQRRNDATMPFLCIAAHGAGLRCDSSATLVAMLLSQAGIPSEDRALQLGSGTAAWLSAAPGLQPQPTGLRT